MRCPGDFRFHRILLLGLAPLVTVWVAGCPMDGNGGNEPPDNGDTNPPGQPTPTEDIEIEVSIEPVGSGTVSQTSTGNVVTVTASPAPGWSFAQWFGSTNSTANPLTILATTETQLGAQFAPILPDADGDGVPNADDVCAGHDDTVDTDRDGVPDGCEVCPGGDDRDDTDGDDIPDACDPCPNDNPDDSDEDDICDTDDICPGFDDSVDADADTIPDGCDDCPNDRLNDADNDGVCGNVDQCPETLPGVVVDEVGCPRPVNDVCLNAVAVGDGETAIDTRRASSGGPDSGDLCLNEPRSDIWYCYTATCNGTALIDVCDSTFDTILAIYSGCACNALGDAIACDDDGCGTIGGPSTVAFDVTEGETFAIRLGGFDEVSTGAGTLSIDCDSSCTTDAQCNDGNLCTDDICSDVTGECVNLPNSVACTDGNPCTVGDVCSEGICESGDPADCSLAGDQCNMATCSPTGDEGNCESLIPINEGETCDDENVCTAGETCNSGSCNGGVGPDCSEAGDACNVAGCDPSGAPLNCDAMTPIREGLSCDDDEACTLGETCASGECGGGSPPNCTEFNIPCNVASCDPTGEVGNCDRLSPVADGTGCDDDEFCNGTDSCLVGSCSEHTENPCAGTGLECSESLERCVECFRIEHCEDGFDCTFDGCEDNVCVFTPVDTACNDGLLCTIDTCDLEVGCQNTPVQCPSGEQCDPTTGACIPIPCTTPDECDDGVACTVDDCDLSSGSGRCVNLANDALCDDGLFCTGVETCDDVLGCMSSGDPCPQGQICDVDEQRCVSEPATWNSTQLLFGTEPGFDPPEAYSLDAFGQLVSAALGLTAQSLEQPYPTADEIEVINTSAPLGVETDLYRVHEPEDFFDPDRTTRASVLIEIFDLTLQLVGDDLIATWTFDHTLRLRVETSGGTTETTTRITGMQTGIVSQDATTITWTETDGIRRVCQPPDSPNCIGVCLSGTVCLTGGLSGEPCSVDSDCDVHLNDNNFPLGVWTR